MRIANWKNPLCPVRPMGSNWGAVMTRYKPSITISIQSVDFNLSVNSEYFHQLWVLLIRSIPLYPARPVGSSWRVVIIRYRIPAIIRSTWDKKVNRVQSTGYSSIANHYKTGMISSCFCKPQLKWPSWQRLCEHSLATRRLLRLLLK